MPSATSARAIFELIEARKPSPRFSSSFSVAKSIDLADRLRAARGECPIRLAPGGAIGRCTLAEIAAS